MAKMDEIVKIDEMVELVEMVEMLQILQMLQIVETVEIVEIKTKNISCLTKIVLTVIMWEGLKKILVVGILL